MVTDEAVPTVRRKYQALSRTVLSGRSCMSCSQTEQPFGRGLNFLLSHPRA
jgi:hypothetical protein